MHFQIQPTENNAQCDIYWPTYLE